MSHRQSQSQSQNGSQCQLPYSTPHSYSHTDWQHSDSTQNGDIPHSTWYGASFRVGIGVGVGFALARQKVKLVFASCLVKRFKGCLPLVHFFTLLSLSLSLVSFFFFYRPDESWELELEPNTETGKKVGRGRMQMPINITKTQQLSVGSPRDTSSESKKCYQQGLGP